MTHKTYHIPEFLKRSKFTCVGFDIGWSSPQVLIQFTPLYWGLGGGIGTRRVALKIGPLAIVVAFWIRPFDRCTFHDPWGK